MNTDTEVNDVLIVDILTAPSPTGFGSSLPATNGQWEGHPLVSKVVGVAAASLTIARDTSYVTWYGFDVGDEVSSLDYAHDVVMRGAGAIVTFGPNGYVMRMLEARLREHGFCASSGWAGFGRANLDLADEVMLGGAFPRVSLADAVAMYELLAHDPASAHVSATEGPAALTPEALAHRLRVRMDALVSLFTQLRVGPASGVAGSLVMRETASPSAEGRLAS